MCEKSLDTLFNEVENGICTNVDSGDTYAGVVNLTEGLDTLSYGLKGNSGVVIETSEDHSKK